ncbi:leucine-rich repeats and immunoglobulin-like domains protein 1 isoform X3 [Dreissena polymorpha]|uniref:leucine-rich repeats and immunoglobulin-like domains protein 1 isoform X3 n=1 Tax=Dreissena polymorpha TaxID=45954 RepID=UPI00226430E8|nr:leucine-rich repeats and immunoglobulin-like domains protein 1 isoform X3 [Dreissena polymorpha]
MEIKRLLVKLQHFGRTWLLFLIIFLRHSDAYDYYRRNPSPIPRFLPVPMNITVHEGETAHLRCRIHNLGPKFVVWRKADEESPLTLGKTTFTPDKDIEVQIEEINPQDVENEESRYDLIIKNVSKDQEGTYACQISATKNYTFNITLNLLEPIKYIQELELTGTEYVSIMEDIRLVCNATGALKAPDSVDWFFDGEPISKMKPGRILQLNSKPMPGRSLISELVIKNVTTDDRGHYVCLLTKTLAQGFKVHVLNDKKNHKDPKRDLETERYSYNTDHAPSDALESHGKNDALAVYWSTSLQTSLTTATLFWTITSS